MSLPYIFFYLLALAFAAFMIFSPTGEMTALDTVFYALDKIGFLAFPPLLLHFFMIFPLRNRFLKDHPNILLALYAPAGLLFLARLRMHLPFPRPVAEAAVLRTQDALERLELLHFAALRPHHAGPPGGQHRGGPPTSCSRSSSASSSAGWPSASSRRRSSTSSRSSPADGRPRAPS